LVLEVWKVLDQHSAELLLCSCTTTEEF